QPAKLLDRKRVAEPFHIDPSHRMLVDEGASLGRRSDLLLDQIARPVGHDVNRRLGLAWIGDDRSGRRARRTAKPNLRRGLETAFAAHAALSWLWGWARWTSTGRSTFRWTSRCRYAMTIPRSANRSSIANRSSLSTSIFLVSRKFTQNRSSNMRASAPKSAKITSGAGC